MPYCSLVVLVSFVRLTYVIVHLSHRSFDVYDCSLVVLVRSFVGFVRLTYAIVHLSHRSFDVYSCSLFIFVRSSDVYNR